MPDSRAGEWPLPAVERHTDGVILSENANFLGDDLIVWLLLALGGALLAGNVMALIRPPEQRSESDLAAAPRGRSILMAVIGLVVVVAALGGLIGR